MSTALRPLTPGDTGLMQQLRHGAVGLAIVLAILAAGSPSASASHIKGGVLNVSITAGGRLQGSLLDIRNGSTLSEIISVTPPVGSAATFTVTLVQTRRYGSTIYSYGTFDQDLATLLGGPAPNGVYTVSHIASSVVLGIVNYRGGPAWEAATVNWTSGTAAAGPQLGYTPSLPISIGNPYSQNLLATGTGLVYTSLANAGNSATFVSPTPGTTSDVISISSTGQITIPAATTAGFANAAYYAYNVQVTDAAGNYNWVTLVLQATTDQPATFTAPTSTSFQVAAGGTLTIPLSAVGFLAGDTVTLFSSTLPAWITFSQTAGNPATGSFVISPPANTTPQTLQLGCDAVVTSQVNPLVTSLLISLQVVTAGSNLPNLPRGNKKKGGHGCFVEATAAETWLPLLGVFLALASAWFVSRRKGAVA